MKNLTFLKYWSQLAGEITGDQVNRAAQAASTTLGFAILAAIANPSAIAAEAAAGAATAPVASGEVVEPVVAQSGAGSSDPLFIEPVESPPSGAPTPTAPSPTEELPTVDVPIRPVQENFREGPEVEVDTSLDADDAEVSAVPSIRFKPLESVPADGRSLVQVEGEVVNADGTPFTDDVVVTLSAGAGRFVGDDADEERVGFQVIAKDGKFSARLRSPIQAQWTKIRAAIDPVFDLKLPPEKVPTRLSPLSLPTTPYKPKPESLLSETYTEVEFTTFLRSSLVSGSVDFRVGKGTTNFYGSFADFLDPDGDDGYGVDLDGGLFATGALGDWLFTGAVNLDRGLNDDCNGPRLFRDFDSNCDGKLYPVYGDSSTVDYLTPSKDSVYARLERNSLVPGAEPDYLMWGDWYTNEFARPSQLFSAVSRGLHGAKINYSLGGFQATGAYANNVQGFRRDTIALTGTSGLYFLSQRLLIPGSETLFLEVEEINRPGVVVERKSLRRTIDYDVDYDRGAVTFRRAMFGTEFDPFGTTLVRRVVATYESEEQGKSNSGLFAGRLQYNFSRDSGKESWVGATYLNEDQGARNFQLFGADFLVPLGTAGSFIGEYARSENGADFLGEVDGSAYRLEAEGKPTDWLKARAYYRTAEEGFANDATFSFVPGQTRYGVQGVAQAGETTQVSLEFDREENFGNEILLQPRFFDIFDPNPLIVGGPGVANNLTTFRGGIIQKLGAADLGLEYVNRSRDDDKGTSLNTNSSQLVTKLRVPIGEKFAFRGQNELNLGSSDELYPNRTTLGLEWAAYPGVKLRLAHQFFDGGILDSSAITSLDTITDYALGENTDLTSRYSILGTRNGMSSYGSVGLNHRWKVSPGFRINLGYERIFDDLFGRTGAGSRFETPYAVGQTASVLGLSEGSTYSVGFDYTGSETFKGSGRVEYRDAKAGDVLFSTFSGLGKLSDSFSLLGRVEFSGASNQELIGRLGDTFNGRLGLAYRNPLDDRFNGLLRLEHRVNGDNTPNDIGTGSESRDTVLSSELIYAPNWRWEFYGKYAARWAETELDGGFSNDSFISLAQLRALYRFDYRWDVAAETRWINQSSADFSEWGLAAELGYYLSPDLRAYLGYSFGSVDDRDFSGYRSEGGVYGGLNLKVNRLFNDFGVQTPVPKPVEATSAAAKQENFYTAPIEAVEEEAAPAAEASEPVFFEKDPTPAKPQEEIPRALF